MSSLSHHGIKGQRWGVRRFQNKDGTLTAAGRKRKQHLIEVGSGKRKRLIEAAKPFGSSGDYSRDVTGLNRRGIHGQVINEDDNTHIIKKGTSIYRTAANPELNDDGTYGSLTKNDVDRYIDYGRSGELPGADKSNLNSMKIFEFSSNRDLKIASGKYITEIITDDVKHKMKNGDSDQVKFGKEILESFKRHEEDLNISFSPSEMRRSKEAYSRTEAEKEFDRGLLDKANDRLNLYDKKILDYASGKDYRVIRDRLKREGYDGFIDVEDVTTIENLVRGGANTEYPVVILNANDVLTLKRSIKESETQRRLKRGTKFNSSRGELANVVQHTSIGGTMYIEGNALILGDSSYLEHHGILGQKWGVRRFQNKDGTRTAAGKAREDRRVLKKGSMVYRVHAAPKDYVYDNKKYVSTNIEDHNKWADYFGNEYAIRWKPVYYQRYKTKKDLYVATGKDIVDVVSTKLDKQMVKRDLDSLEKEVKLRGYDWDNTSKEDHYSMLLGAQKESGKQIVHELQKMGFGAIEDDHGKNVAKDPVIVLDPDKKLRRYGKTAKDTRYLESYRKAFNEFFATHTSIGGTMYIEGNALILGDSSYLEHHGIKGQRWGVRRFQNRDGSLTNAGRKRLGYATKGAAQTVKKAFKAGVKAGGNAVKAAKAHHEKKEAEKLQKKKEKASKTRLGVMANKDLFTNEEIRKLNERFKLEDEMKMATLQKGVEIAKAVGTIAQNVGTVAKTYEDVTGQSLSPIKRKAAEEKARQDKEDRERRIAREDADEARKAAKEERDIAIHEQTLRKAIAAADTQEFTAQKTKAEADSSVLDAIKKGQDFNGGGGTDASGQSWVEKAKNGGKNPFDDMIANRDPEYAQIRKEHDEKVARKERIAELERREKEREAEKAAASRQSAPQQKQGGGDDDALFSQKGSLPIDKDRYRNNRAMEKAKQVKEDAAEERAKKQDEKAVNQTIDDTIEANRSFKETVRAQDPHAYDRGVAKDYIKGKLNNLPNALADLNPINRAAKKIADKATKEEEAQVRKSMKEQYDQMVKSDGRDEANYVMYNTRVANLQQQGYSERKAKQIADSNPTFSAKRNRKKEYYDKTGELESTHRKNAQEIRKANKELTDYYYKLINGPGYDPGTPKREALDRKYKQKRGELERLDKDNNEMLEKGMKEAKKILEHSFSIQNGVLFVDSSDSLAHHDIKGLGIQHTSMEEGMYHVENGTLFINAGEPYLEHHGVKGMKWGKHLMAGKGEAGAGGGSGEDDEKLKEMAKKAGMSVAEYKQKFASKIGGAASKVGSAVYDAAGGSHKKNAEGWRKMAREESNAARASEKSAHENSARAASQDRKYGSGGDVYRRAADSDRENAETHRSNAKSRSERAASEQAAYEKSLAGKYDKMKARGAEAGKRARKAVNELTAKARKTTEQKKLFSGTSPKAKKAAIAKKKATPTSYEKRISDARNNVEKAARANEGAYKHAISIYRQSGSDSDAYKQAIKRSRTTLQRYIDSKKLLKKKKRAKHFDDANAVYTEGTKLVINSKWG